MRVLEPNLKNVGGQGGNLKNVDGQGGHLECDGADAVVRGVPPRAKTKYAPPSPPKAMLERTLGPEIGISTLRRGCGGAYLVFARG